jgi:hypothetical protein
VDEAEFCSEEKLRELAHTALIERQVEQSRARQERKYHAATEAVARVERLLGIKAQADYKNGCAVVGSIRLAACSNGPTVHLVSNGDNVFKPWYDEHVVNSLADLGEYLAGQEREEPKISVVSVGADGTMHINDDLSQGPEERIAAALEQIAEIMSQWGFVGGL